MTRIHIPAAALEAGARAIHDMRYGTHLYSADDMARATFEAMVGAWEGMNTEHREVLNFGNNIDGPIVGVRRAPFLILPLPQEKPDGE